MPLKSPFGTKPQDTTKFPMLIAVVLMLMSSVVVVTDAVIVRYLAAEIHPFEMLFFRNLFAVLFLLPLLAKPDLRLTANGMWPVHIVRAILKLGALSASFLAITMLPLSVVTAIAFTTPLFAAMGSAIFLGEKLKTARLLALFLGFIGVIIVLRPTEAPIGLGAGLALGSAVALAGVVLLIKFSSSRDSAPRIVYLNLIVSVPLAAIICIPVWTMPSLAAFGLLVIQGAGGLISQMAVARAMRLADASLLVPLEFVRLPMAVVLGYLLFAEQIDLAVVIGGSVILSAIVILLIKGRQVPLSE